MTQDILHESYSGSKKRDDICVFTLRLNDLARIFTVSLFCSRQESQVIRENYGGALSLQGPTLVGYLQQKRSSKLLRKGAEAKQGGGSCEACEG